jgi:hypothetical protein
MGILRCNLSFWALTLHTAESHLRTKMTSVQLGGSEAMEPLAIGKALQQREERGAGGHQAGRVDFRSGKCQAQLPPVSLGMTVRGMMLVAPCPRKGFLVP